jgi:membrane-bound lytic murein transglycosylase B
MPALKLTRAAVILGLALLSVLANSRQSGAQEKPDYFAVVRQRLITDGFSSEAVAQLYGRPEVFLEADGVSRFFVHSEAKLNYDQFTTPESIQKARAYMREYRVSLDSAEKAYGVDPRVITAILLVESRLGTVSGSRSCLNILSTLAALSDSETREAFWRIIPDERRISRAHYDERVQKRAEWGYRELKALLRYAEREKIDPAGITGSYADSDGGIDLRTHADAIASIANYLKRHGWQPEISREKAEKVVHSYNPSSYYVNAILKIADLLKG